MTVRELIEQRRLAAAAQVELCDSLLEQLVDEEPTPDDGQPIEEVPTTSRPAKNKATGRTSSPSTKRGPLVNRVAVARALVAAPKTLGEVQKVTGLGANPCRSALLKFGPEANGSAWFAKLDDGRWALTDTGRRELAQGEE